MAETFTPYLHHPTMLDDDAKNGLMCFKDASRQCGADCMAYLITPPAGDEYQDQQWAQCRLLVDSHRTAKHLVILTGTVGTLEKFLRHKAADDARHAPPPGAPR